MKNEDTALNQASIRSAIDTYSAGEIAKFVTSQRPLPEEEWSAYKGEREAYGILNYIKNAEEAFNTLYNNGVVG